MVTGGTPRPGRMLFITAAWGTCFAAIRFGLADAPVLWLAALRALIAGVALLAAARLTRAPAVPRSAWPTLLALGTVNVAVAFAAMFAGTAGVATGVAAVLANAQPLLIVIPAWALFAERPSRRAIAGVAVGFAGLIVAATPAGGGRGALMSVGAAVAITAGTLLTRRLAGLAAVAATGWQFVLGGAILVAWAFAAEGPPHLTWSARLLLAVGFLALAGTAAPYLLWFVEIQRAPLLAVSAWTMLTPVFGVVLGFALFSERLSGRQAIGVTLVLLALPMILLRPMRPTTMGALPGAPDARGAGL